MRRKWPQIKACTFLVAVFCYCLFSLYFQQRALPTLFPQDGQSWVVLSPLETQIRCKIQAAGKPLKDWGVSIYRGILTGFNDAFIIDEVTKNDLIKKSPESAEIIRPLLEATDLSRYGSKQIDSWFINSHNGVAARKIAAIDIPTSYPIIHEHFLKYKEQLIKRGDKGAQWYNLRACSYLDDFEKPKIVWGNLSTKPRFSLEESRAYLVAPCNILTSSTENLRYLLAVLNSNICYFFMRNQGYSREGGYIEYKKQFVEQMVIPAPNDIFQQRITNLVDEIVKRKAIGSETLGLEEKIDDLMAIIFDLTSSEASYLKTWSAAN